MITDTFDDIANSLSEFLKANEVIFLKCDITDFRKLYTGVLSLVGPRDVVGVDLNSKHFSTLVGILTYGLAGKTLYTWDVKKLYSYICHRWPRQRVPGIEARVIDIKYGESFLGTGGSCPETFSDAHRRATAVAKNDACMRVHDQIYVPLATRVLPKIETAGVVDAAARAVRYPVYDIEGQVHGRLACRAVFPGGLLAHNIRPEERPNLRPTHADNLFAVLDYRAMEVHVLWWLTRDERLGKIISSGRDIYSTIYSLLFGLKCTDQTRQFIKQTFLPIIYGQQAKSLAAEFNIQREDAADLIAKVGRYFGTAVEWVQTKAERARRGEVVCDFFGRPRRYDDKHHVVRNAVVQGPAAVVCLEKLIALWDRVFGRCEVALTVHDAYILDTPAKSLRNVIVDALDVLESESVMCPGLRLPVKVAVGRDLANLSEFKL